MTISTESNVVQKEADKKLKYKGLCIEMQRMWNMKCWIIPVINGANGIVAKCLKKNLEDIQGKYSVDSLTTKDSYTRNITHTA